MDDDSETSINSARALIEHNKKKTHDAAAANKISQLASEQVALLKESNELAKKALIEKNLKTNEEKNTDMVDIKPNFFGFGINLNEVWRRFKNGFKNKNT